MLHKKETRLSGRVEKSLKDVGGLDAEKLLAEEEKVAMREACFSAKLEPSSV